jgi:DNA-binding NarL/FixJ family response regulator
VRFFRDHPYGQGKRGPIKIDLGVRVLVASGYSANGPTKEALEGGARGFVPKPYDMGQLLQTVRKVPDEG